MKLFIRLVILLVLAGGIGAVAWFTFAAPPPPSAPSTSVVGRGAVEQTVLATGILEASALVNVGAEVSGRIETLHVTLGQRVSAGDLIAEIESLNQENAVRVAEAALASAEAQKRIQEASTRQSLQALARSEQLRGQNLVSSADYENAVIAAEMAQAQLDQLDAQILQAELNVDSAQLNLDRTRIVAPAGGTVVAVLVDEGQTVNANAEIPTLVMLANLDEMIVKAEISEADVPRVAPGQRVYFTILGEPDSQIDATLLDIEPAPETIATGGATSASAVYYNGRFVVPNPDHKLRISMTAQVTIVLAEARDVIVVPSSALTTHPQRGASVRIYDPATEAIETRAVTVGLNNNIIAEITGGLDEGELIVDGMARAGAGPMGGFGGGGFGGPGLFR